MNVHHTAYASKYERTLFLIAGGPYFTMLTLNMNQQSGVEISILPSLFSTQLSGLKDLFETHGFVVETFFGAGYYPLPTGLARLFARCDARHSAFLTIKLRKT